MAEATQAEILAAAAEQKATDPRIEQTALGAPQVPEPAPEPAPEPVAATEPEPAPEPIAEPTPKAKKSPVEALTGRVGHLTKTIADKDRALTDAIARAEAAERLLGARAPEAAPTGEQPPAPAQRPADINPQTGRTYTQAEFDQAVATKAATDELVRRSNDVYAKGAERYGDAWHEGVQILNAAGAMTNAVLEIAMETDDPAGVFHYLADDVGEAQRIAALPPIRMAAELTKIGARLATPTPAASPRVSSAPAPVPSVRGAVTPTVDLTRMSETDDMAAYRAARAGQGAWYAQRPGQRTVR